MEIKKISQYKEILLSSVVILVCLFLSFLFPIRNIAQYITATIFFFVLIPVLYIKIVLRKNLSDFGLNLKNKRQGIFWGTLGILFLFLLFYLLYTYTPFQNSYSLPDIVVNNFWAFLFYELIIVNFIIIIWEFFFLGFFFFTFIKNFSYWTIPLQLAIFSLIIFFTSGLSWQEIPTLAISLISAIIVYRSRSIFYSYVVALFFNLILDSFIIYNLK